MADLDQALNFSLSEPSPEKSATDSLSDMQAYLAELDNRSANKLAPRTPAQSLDALQNNNVAGMEALDIVRKGDYLYAMQQEPGREAVYIPIEPAKAMSILAGRNQIRRDATDRLRQKEEDERNKSKLISGLRAAGYKDEELMGITESIAGMDFPNAQAMTRDLLKAKISQTGTAAGASGNILASHQQKVRYSAAENARQSFLADPELARLNEMLSALEESGRHKYGKGLQQHAALKEQIGARSAVLVDKQRKMAVVGRFSVPNSSDQYDPRTYVQVASQSALGQGAGGLAQANSVLQSVIPLMDAARDMGLIPSAGADEASIINALNMASEQLTGRLFVTSPAEVEALRGIFAGQQGYDVFDPPESAAGEVGGMMGAETNNGPAVNQPSMPTQPESTASRLQKINS